MRIPLVSSLALALVLTASGAFASSPAWISSVDGRGELLASSTATPSLRLSDRQLDALLSSDDERPNLDAFDGSEGAPRRWWPVALSALVPGLGETLTGHRRGWLMLAADAGLWYGVYDQHQEGEDWEDRYQAFALEHWSEQEWIIALQNGELVDFFPDFGVGTGPDDVSLYVTREEDEREWFENLGKWDVFAWGWREFWDPAIDYDPTNVEERYDPDNPFMTPLRDQYLDMRGESNDAFDRRDTFLNVAVLFRVFSVIQTAYLEGFIGGRYDAAQPGTEGPRLGWVIEPRGATETLVGWKVSY